jgi:hypothetical protein
MPFQTGADEAIKEEQDSHMNTPSIDDIYVRLAKFVHLNSISRDEFNRTINIYLTPEEMVESFQNIGMKEVTLGEVNGIFKDFNCLLSGYLEME